MDVKEKIIRLLSHAYELTDQIPDLSLYAVLDWEGDSYYETISGNPERLAMALGQALLPRPELYTAVNEYIREAGKEGGE
jgi:hypothetical protein